MVATSPLNAAEPLPELWRAWTRIIGVFAKRARSGLRPAPGEYESLHRTLLALCEERATTDAAGREYYRQLGEVARPWVTLHALQITDRELLAELYTRCRRIDRELHNGEELWDGEARWVTPSTVFLTVVAVLVGVALATGLFGWLSETIDRWGFVLRIWWIRRSTAELVLIGAGVIVVVGWVLVSRTRRS